MPAPVAVAIWRVGDSRASLPKYMTPGAAGCDLAAEIPAPLILQPMERVLVPTGLAIALPEGLEAQVRPRSGLAMREGITMVNSPGTIDADYRGEIKIAIVNLSTEERTIQPGDRIAQLVVAPVIQVQWQLVDGESGRETARGAGGFGHTGVGTVASSAEKERR